MPQKGDPLTEADVKLLKAWIAEGAKDDTPATAKTLVDQDHPPQYNLPPVINALALLQPEAEFVAIHDAVRPCVTEALIDAVFAKAVQTGAALLAVPVSDTLKQVDAQHKVQATKPRQGLWLAQTPQVFRRDWIVAAHANRGKLGKDITDDAQLIEAAGHPVYVVEGSPQNIKITTKADLLLAEAILKAQPKPKPTGPIHPFAEEEMWGGRP